MGKNMTTDQNAEKASQTNSFGQGQATTLSESLKNSVEFIHSKCSLKPRIGITLGSGLGDFVNQVRVEQKIPYGNIPGFFAPSVEGHSGQLILGYIGETPVAVLQGRTHFYEGRSLYDVVYPTRVLARLGIETLILTNAAGGLDPNMKPGDFVIITDHINLTGQNPLIGPNEESIGPRFPDMAQMYTPELSDTLAELLTKKKIRFTKGVYCGVTGPSYETAAEIKYLHSIGGSAVGMSTVAEAIAARHMGIKLCGISCVTNLGTGLSTTPITHEEVKEVGQRVAHQFSDFLTDFVKSV